MSTCYIWGPMAPVREIEMGGGGVRQTDGTEMVGRGGGGGSDSQKEGVARQETESGT